MSLAADLLENHLTREQVAIQLNCSTRTVARMSQQPNGLPYIVLAGRLYYDRADIIRWIESRKVQPNPTRRRG